MVKYTYSDHKQLPWAKIIIPKYVKPFLQIKAAKGLKPTVRGTCYYLEKSEIILKEIFRNAEAALAAARKRNPCYKDGTENPGYIPEDAFSDSKRTIIKDFDDEERSLEDFIDNKIAQLKYLPNGFKTLVPRWLEQPNYVEVWVEKAAMADSVKMALEGLDVVIAPNRGWPSITFVHNNIDRLIIESERANRENIYVLYLGDLDPAGWAMDKMLKQKLGRMKFLGEVGTQTHFKRIGVTEEQLDKYNLRHLTNADPAVIRKLNNPRNRFVKPFVQHFGSAFQIELEVLDALPNFGDIIKAEVNKFYDQDVYEEVLRRPEYSQEPGTIKNQIIEALEPFIEELEDSS